MKPLVDEDLCIGCGSCEEACPAVFQLGDDGLSHVIADNPDPEQYGCIRDAEAICPTSAITIEE
jgi:ferredoxin